MKIISTEMIVHASSSTQPFIYALQEQLNCSIEETVKQLEKESNIQFCHQEELNDFSPNFKIFSYSESLKKKFIYLEQENKTIFVHENPFDSHLQTWATYKIDKLFEFRFCDLNTIQKILEKNKEHEKLLASFNNKKPQKNLEKSTEDISLTSIANNTHHVIQLVNSTLYDAQKMNASDIHFENTSNGLVIKYRIDGVLNLAKEFKDQHLTEQVISRIKVMAELDISEKRIPQDGRFSVLIDGREIDFRVSIMPSLFGEDAVLRILDNHAITTDIQELSLDVLGIEGLDKKKILQLANQPYGMLLVTGPTGSGKTTTLYATLSEINFGGDKIITIEDPIEYQLPHVLQIPVNEKKGLTFAKGLRSILRHDPDRILVGEIRDKDTAEIAVQAALTGHVVYTTVHANNVFDVLSRFHHMGIDKYSFLTALNGVVAQKLVRLICNFCKKDDRVEMDLIQQSGLKLNDVQQWNFKKGEGCIHCRDTGYKGRRALTEVLMFNDEIRELVMNQVPIAQLKEKARNNGMLLIREQALNAVKQGQTTLQEINRVTFVE